MSRLLLSVQADECNAWSSDVTHGLPSPMSVALYLRALFLENRDLGFGEPLGFLMALRSILHDRGSYGTRPLLTYVSKDPDAVTPLFDEHRCSLDLQIVVQTSQDPLLTTQPGQEAAGLQALQRRMRFQRFLGGQVQTAHVHEARNREDLLRQLRGSRVYIDETASLLRAGYDSLQVLRAVTLANLPANVQDKATQKWGIPESLWTLVNHRWLRVMPLAYRRITPFIERDDARFVLDNDRRPQSSVHAFVESAHGVVELLGPVRAFDSSQLRKIWWKTPAVESLDAPLIFSVQGTPYHG